MSQTWKRRFLSYVSKIVKIFVIFLQHKFNFQFKFATSKILKLNSKISKTKWTWTTSFAKWIFKFLKKDWRVTRSFIFHNANQNKNASNSILYESKILFVCVKISFDVMNWMFNWFFVFWKLKFLIWRNSTIILSLNKFIWTYNLLYSFFREMTTYVSCLKFK